MITLISEILNRDMENLFIQRNLEAKTPEIDFKADGKLKIEGRSVSENPVVFFDPIILWLNNFKAENPKSIVFEVKLEYFNTSTSKILLHIFRIMETIVKDGADVKILWHYDNIDDDLREAGMDYQSIIKVPFEFIEI